MAKYRTDLMDVNFNLFKACKIQDEASELGYGEADLKDILTQFDKFVENEIYPTRQISDEIGVKHVDGKVIVPEVFHQANKAFYENGWYALGYPEEVGGMPAPHAMKVACTSMAIGSNVAWSMYYGLSQGAMNVILKVGSQEQKDLFVTKMMTGEWGGTMCLTEPGAGSDVGNANTTAKPLDNGKYTINGVKIFISSGESDLYENNIHLVLARTPGAPEGTKGLSLFIVPRFNVETGESNNVKCTKLEHKMGIHAQATCELTFGQDGECVGELIGKEFDGMKNMFIMMNEARLLCGLQGEAQSNLCFELTEQYAKERSQFGTEIINMPDVKRMLLKMRSTGRGLRALSLYTANLFDKAEKGDEEADKEIALFTPICKGFCTDEGVNIASDGVQVHGGYGYCTEYGIEQFMRDTKIATIYEGTNGIQAIDFVMRKILMDKGETFFNVGKKIHATMNREEAKAYPHEVSMIGKSMEMSEEVVKKFGSFMAANNQSAVLAHATDFLSYCGNLVVSWLLLEHACIAQNELKTATSEEEKKYYQSKIDDFKVFCQYQLTRNIGLAHSVLNFEEDLTSINV
ncbi:acyl-CoA dehydrogenase [Halobacteriovorax sp. RZ-1]|uniref:acyl-CoA dehydrogenase n=1 Tax=unclassified Halobacteriovorax TaxID=2639665 RepID=UPI0037122BB2